MSTQKQTDANRRNAAKSTGPRTPAGKIRARANALKHGLAAKSVRDESKRQQIDALTRVFAGQTGSIAARAIAEAQVELQCVERYRADLLSKIPPLDDPGANQEGEEITNVVLRLEKLLRYERRATSKRNKALK
jgi:hypothetical protein